MKSSQASIKTALISTILLIMVFETFSATFRVNSQSDFEHTQEQIKVNDSIIWSAGKYFDVHLTVTVSHLFFLAEYPGAVIFSGSSTLRVNGDSNTISGFQFVNGTIEGDVIDISGNSNTLKHVNIQSYDSHYYLRVRPDCQYNIISHCNFEGKPETQESSVVQIEASEKMPGYHIVTHCSFKNHTAPPDAGGDFGIEALRIGYSYQRTFISRTIVEYCFFEKCNGDYEVISNKACENILRYNTFIDNGPAHLTLRHGSRAMVYGNFFINGAGIRIKEGQNHAVVNNYFDTKDHFSIHIQNHHFDPVDTVKIVNNTFISHYMILGGEGEYQPKNILFANNLFAHQHDPVVSDKTGTERWKSNVTQPGIDQLPGKGFIQISFSLRKNKYGFYEPDLNEKSLGSYESLNPQMFNIQDLDDDFTVAYDIMKQKRKDKLFEVPGCYISSQTKPMNCFAQRTNTGPIYLK